MATKAERFRATAERDGAATQAKRASTSSKRVPGNATASRTAQSAKTTPRPSGRTRKAESASYQWEATAPSKRPSRKQTRGSVNRQKTDAVLKSRQELRISSPQRRHSEHQR